VPVSYAVISWEVSTSPARQAAVSSAVEAALAPFNPARLLTTSVLIDTDSQNVTHLRRALDGVRAAFPQELFYTSADQAASDLQGIYPPFADLGRARATTGSKANPRERGAAPVAAAGGVAGPVGRRKASGKPSGRRRIRATGSRPRAPRARRKVS